MSDDGTHKYTPLLPFNDIMKDGFIIYDNVVYVRDVDLTDKKFENNHSDNMIKYYTTCVGEPIRIGGG